MKYTNSCKIYWFLLSRILKKEIIKKYGREYTNSLLKKAKKEYKAIIFRAPDIGGKENKLINNIYMGVVFVACYKVSRGKINHIEMGKIIADSLNNSKIVELVFKNENQATDKYREWIKNVSKWTQDNAEKYPTNWIMQENEGMHKIGSYFEFSHCALYELCKAEGCPEITSQLCKIDFITANFGKSKLIRKSTIADGSTVCDYWFIEKTNN